MTPIPPFPPDFSPPKTLFRYGEACGWMKRTFAPGSRLTSTTWPYVLPVPVAFEVQGLSWQLYTESTRDLDAVLWECALEWDFQVTKVPIGPLTQSAGGIGDHLFPDSRGDMEKLAETGNALPSEEMWRILTQGNRVGDVYSFNGRMSYRKHPVLIPASTQVGIRLYSDSEQGITFSEEFRIRVILHGVFKNVIEIA